MAIAASLVLFAVGAILRFAVTVTTSGFNIHTIGIILMIVGGVGFLISMAFWGFSGWGGGGRSRRTRYTTVSGPAGTTSAESREEQVSTF